LSRASPDRLDMAQGMRKAASSSPSGQLAKGGFHPIQAPRDRLHARGIRQTEMRGTAERLTRHDGDPRLVEEIRGQLRSGGDGNSLMPATEDSGHVSECVERAGRHAAADA